MQVPYLKMMAPAAAILGVAVALVLALRHISYLGGETVDFIDPGTDLLMSLAFAVLLAYLMLQMPPRIGARVNGLARRLAFLGTMSYSLYVVHYPWIMFVSAWWLWQHDRLPVGAELVVAGAASAFLLGWCLWYAVERHCVATKRVATGVSPAPVKVAVRHSGDSRTGAVVSVVESA
jgi:peptidoglycan/LPS O-acetylase OafA/YrhL